MPNTGLPAGARPSLLNVSNRESSPRLPSVKAIAVLSVLVLAVTIALSAWSYMNGTPALRVQGRATAPDTDTLVQNASALLKQMDRWAFKVTLGTAMGGAGLILVSVFAFAWWRKALADERFGGHRNGEGDSKKLQELTSQLRQQAAECCRLEAELQKATVDIDNRVAERTAALSKSYASLEAELNERKHAERMLAQQA